MSQKPALADRFLKRALSQSNPLKAVAELVENSINARATKDSHSASSFREFLKSKQEPAKSCGCEESRIVSLRDCVKITT
jgi:hypothetical protein